jgi:hypothetical protein
MKPVDMKKENLKKTIEASDNDSLARRVAQILSLSGFGLMAFGFVTMLARQGTISMPGGAALPFPGVLRLAGEPISLAAMSLGILILAIVPATEVMVAEWRFIHRREILNILAALIVLMELLLSIGTGSRLFG